MDTFFTEFETDRLHLNRVLPSDKKEILILRSHPEILTYLAREPMKDDAEALKWIGDIENAIQERSGINWALRIKGSDTLIGVIGFWKFNKDHFRAEIGYTLNHHYHKKGYMTEAIRSIIPFAFDSLNLHSIQAEIDPYNIGSKSLLEKVGFKKEALFTENFYFRGEFSDSAVYSLLKKWYIKK